MFSIFFSTQIESTAPYGIYFCRNYSGLSTFFTCYRCIEAYIATNEYDYVDFWEKFPSLHVLHSSLLSKTSIHGPLVVHRLLQMDQVPEAIEWESLFLSFNLSQALCHLNSLPIDRPFSLVLSTSSPGWGVQRCNNKLQLFRNLK